MDGSPQKLTDVTFDERRRGYDPEQVDNYLAKVAQAVDQLQDLLREAVSRAEGAEARLARAKRSEEEATAKVAALESELAEARSAPAPAAPAPAAAKGAVDGDELAKVLLMAQRTADQTVEESKQEAKKIVGEARSEATRLVVDAERQRDEVLKGARDEAQQIVEREAAGLKETVAQLEGRRDDLQADLSVLTKYVDEQRRQLAGALETLRKVLEDPAEFRVSPAPVLKTVKTDKAAAPPATSPAPETSPAPSTSPRPQPSQPQSSQPQSWQF